MSANSKSSEQLESELKLGIRRDTYLAWGLVWAGVVVGIGGGFLVYNLKGGNETSALSRLDTYASYLQGTVGSIWALAGFVLIYVAFLGQKLQILQQERQIADQKKQFESEQQGQEQEIAEQRKQFAIQLESIKRQDFERAFFQLLSLHNEITTNIQKQASRPASNAVIPPNLNVGRVCFESWYGVLKSNYSAIRSAAAEIEAGETEDTKRVAKRKYALGVYSDFYKNHQGSLGHYFRNLYHLIKFVKENETITSHREKRRYTSLVRAQLSQYELALLFYNCISHWGDKFKPLVEEFSLLENLDKELLLSDEHEQYYAKGAYADSGAT